MTFRYLCVAFALALITGCANSCNNPTSPSTSGGGGGGTPPTYFLNENYESAPYYGNWLDPDAPQLVKSGQLGGANSSAYCVAFSSPGLNASPPTAHARNTFATLSSTVTVATPLTTSFYMHYGSLSPTASEAIKLHLQIWNGTSDLVMWSFEVFCNGSAYKFNNAPIASCLNCPAAGSGWHKVTIKSTGTTTTSLSFDNNAAEPGAVAAYTGGTTADALGESLLHLTAGNSVNTSGAKFMMDDLQISTP